MNKYIFKIIDDLYEICINNRAHKYVFRFKESMSKKWNHSKDDGPEE